MAHEASSQVLSVQILKGALLSLTDWLSGAFHSYESALERMLPLPAGHVSNPGPGSFGGELED